jgi:hypothetical protein
MTEQPLNDILLELILDAQRHRLGSQERQKALSQLFRALQQPGVLARPRSEQFQGFYNDIYEEATQRLFIYITRKVEAYNPERGSVLAWVNFLLCQRFFIEASRDFMIVGYQGMDTRQFQHLTIDDLDRTLVENNDSSLAESSFSLLKRYLQEDPDGLFSTSCVEKCPEASFQRIALQRLAGYGWRELSEQLDISATTRNRP